MSTPPSNFFYLSFKFLPRLSVVRNDHPFMAAQASALNASSFVLSLRLALPHLLRLLLLTLFDNVSSTILNYMF